MTLRLAVTVLASPRGSGSGVDGTRDRDSARRRAMRGSAIPPAPDAAVATWTATDIDGRTWSAEALRGRVVLVDFWATWCAPCLDDLPRLRAAACTSCGRGLTIIGVSLDRSSPRDFRSWLQRQAIDWPQVREVGMYDSPLARTFEVEAIPASFLFDRDGRLHATSLRGKALEARVDALMETR